MIKINTNLNDLGKFVNNHRAKCYVELLDAVVLFNDCDLAHSIEFVRTKEISCVMEYTETISGLYGVQYIYRKDTYINGRPIHMATYGNIYTTEDLEQHMEEIS